MRRRRHGSFKESFTGFIYFELPDDECEAEFEVDVTITPSDPGTYLDPPSPEEIDIDKVTYPNGKVALLSKEMMEELQEQANEHEFSPYEPDWDD